MTNDERNDLLRRLYYMSDLITNEYPNLEGDFFIKDVENFKIFVVDDDEVMLFSGDQEHKPLDKVKFEEVTQADIDHLDSILVKECMYASEWFRQALIRFHKGKPK